MALTELHLKICGAHGSLSQKGCRPLPQVIASGNQDRVQSSKEDLLIN